jgi:hypothetical protein
MGSPSRWRFGLLAAAVLAAGADPASPTVFEKPVRLAAADGVIDSGPSWGHSGPCLHDADGDGRRDLLVGDFSGFFRLYRNVGTDKEPKYAAAVNLKAGGVDAQVHIY